MDLTYDQTQKAYDHLGSMLLKEAWGSMDPVSWMTATYSTMPLPDRRATAFTVVFTIEPHWREVQGYRQWIAGGHTVAHAYISDVDRHMARDMQVFFQGVKRRIEDSIEDIGTVLYEHDPRIGFLFDGPDAVLPHCPLFTRRGPPWRPKWEGYDYPPPVKETGCLLCASEFRHDETPMWGGSNIGWVHAECWGEGLQPVAHQNTTLLRAR